MIQLNLQNDQMKLILDVIGTLD